MARKIKLGDVYEVTLNDDGIKGYVRVISIRKNQEPFQCNLEHLMIELLKIDPNVSYTIDMLNNLEVLRYFVILSLVARLDGWHYLGNLPIDPDHHIPCLYDYGPQGKCILYHPDGKKIVSKDELGDAILVATIGDAGVRLSYLEALIKHGLLAKEEELSKKEAPDSETAARSFKKLRNEGPVNMNHEMFWEMISNSRKNSRSNSSRFIKILTGEISKLPEEDIFEFENILNHYLVKSYTSELWAAAYIINGGCSDDGFEYFRAWLITRGKDIYENAMKDPQILAKVIRGYQAGEVEFEEFLSICEEAYKMKTGKDDFYDHFEQTAYPEIELNWNEDDGSLEEMFPKLIQKFW